MDMKKNEASIGIGLIGCGRAGMIHGRNFTARAGGARLVAVADASEDMRTQAVAECGEVAAYAQAEDLIADPSVDAVVIATPTAFHRPIAVAAAAAGKHILCEKPMGMDKADCEAMIEAAESGGVKLQIGFMRRYDRSFMEAKEQVDAGAIGQVVQVKSLTHGPSVPRPWMYDLKKSNGPLAEVNSHDIDTLRWFTGSEFETVYAIGGNFRSPDARDDFPDFYDNVSLCALFDSGMQGMISGAQGARYGYDARVEILGTEGIIFIGSLRGSSVVTCSPNGMVRPVVKSWTDLFMDAYRAEDEDFIRCIIEDRPPKAGGIDGLRAVEVVNAGNESIRTGSVVALNQTERKAIK